MTRLRQSSAVLLAFAILLAACSDSTTPEPTGPLSNQWIVFMGLTLETQPFTRLYGVLPDGRGLRTVYAGPPEGTYPRWSRDGAMLAYIQSGLWLMQTDKSDARMINASIYAGPRNLWRLTWSPTGDRILAKLQGSSGMILVNVADGTSSNLNWGRSAERLDWSPVSDRILYQCGVALCVANLDGSANTLVADSAYWPSWSPDGNHIAFITISWDEPPHTTLFVANSDGSNRRQVASGAISLEPPAWSPDGTRIVYKVQEPNSLRITNFDGTGDSPIPTPKLDVSYPVW